VNNYNNAINPQHEESTYTATLMPCRSGKVRKVVAHKVSDGIGGCTDLKTGTVWVPTGDTAKERMIRYHEALHATYTPVKGTPKDMLDQALEDARLHRHCSVSARSEFQQAHNDELEAAEQELRDVELIPVLGPVHSLSVLRAMAMIQAGTVSPEHASLLERVTGKLGKGALKDFETTLALLSDIRNWDKARKVVGKYFAKDFDSTTPLPPPTPPPTPPPDEDKLDDEDESDEEGLRTELSENESDEDGSDTVDSGDSEPSDEPSDSKDGGDRDRETTKDEPTPATATPDAAEIPESFAPAIPAPKPKEKRKAVEPDEYTADLTPACDRGTYEALSASKPLKLFIRRMDMGCNRVKLSMGRKSPLPVISGRKILAGRLAAAMVNPSTRVFTRSVAIGGNGTILIDASGSMSIPEHTLIEFLSKAPALTLAFYNAPADSYGKGHSKTTHGNIYIYAANGYRASAPSIAASAPDYGGGNMIDYQALAWLLKQPAPRYMVTDSRYTGPWARAALRLEAKLVASKEVQVVRGLGDMAKILEELD
jgi:hypothetical protein